MLAHFDSEYASVYRCRDAELRLLKKERFAFDGGPDHEPVAEAVSEFCAGLAQTGEAIDNKTTRLYATGAFQQLPQPDADALVNSVYVDTGLYFNMVRPDLERFYRETSTSESGADSMLEGLIRKEFRNAVVCGSFQQSLGYIEETISRLREGGTEVLSPRSTKIKPETEGSDFILFEYQDLLKNDRDTWRHKFLHMGAFRQADAVVVCNPGGHVGKGTIFELGFMSAISKRVIFTEEPVGVSVTFPCEVGLGA
ncbi:hypothetical protein [Streptomyces californicus]|uniref:hypothetical protein n=1 Tax=Streptomyces californicus TaxID=67351 RepID=UPI0037B7DCF5